jgi:hypothetical protein
MITGIRGSRIAVFGGFRDDNREALAAERFGRESWPRNRVNSEIAFDELSESLARFYSFKIVNQPKGGDPVSHCLSPRSPAFVLWILASSEVQAA